MKPSHLLQGGRFKGRRMWSLKDQRAKSQAGGGNPFYATQGLIFFEEKVCGLRSKKAALGDRKEMETNKEVHIVPGPRKGKASEEKGGAQDCSLVGGKRS